MSPIDHRIPTPRGALFAREWRPAGDGGAPLVLLHDSLGCIDLWRDFPGLLSERTGRRVIAYDRLGFGKSDAFPGRLPLDFILTQGRDDLMPVLDALKHEACILFGHSVGGGMAAVAAAELGARCAGLITESAQLFGEQITFTSIAAARGVFVPGSPPYERLRTYHGEKTEWVVRAWIDNWLDPGFKLDLGPQLKRLACPALAIHGDKDEYGSTAQARMAADLGGARLALLNECGHVPHREKPDAVLDAVATFLKEGP